jgi:hypothetical protein
MKISFVPPAGGYWSVGSIRKALGARHKANATRVYFCLEHVPTGICSRIEKRGQGKTLKDWKCEQTLYLGTFTVKNKVFPCCFTKNRMESPAS